MKRWYHIVAITALIALPVIAQEAIEVPALTLAPAVTVPAITVQPAAPLPGLEPVTLSGLYLYDFTRGESAGAAGVLYVLKTFTFKHSYLSVGPEYVGAFFDEGYVNYAGGGAVWKVTDTKWLANWINRIPFIRRVPIQWAELNANAGAGVQVDAPKNWAIWVGGSFKYGR